jgi:type VI secretion system protein ImpC
VHSAQVDRLCQVAIGLEVVSLDDVGLLARTGQHNDRNIIEIRISPDNLEHLTAVRLREVPVEQNRVGALGVRVLALAIQVKDRLFAIGDDSQSVRDAEVLESQLRVPCIRRIIFDQQNLGAFKLQFRPPPPRQCSVTLNEAIIGDCIDIRPGGTQMSASSRNRAEFLIEAESETAPRVQTEGDEPFRIGVIGDFSGATERRMLAQRRPIEIDRDNFEDVMKSLRPSVDLPAGRMVFTEVDDFHPDSIYSRLPVFEALRDTRERLSDPSTFAEAARDLLGPPEPPPPPASNPNSGDDLIDQLLAEAAAAPARARADDDLQAFIRRSVQPYLVARQDPRAPEMIRQVDDAATQIMRGIVHHPAFQSMEAGWRTVLALVRRLETGADLKIVLFDLTQDELRNEIEAVEASIIIRADPLAVLASTFPFGAADIPLLTSLVRIARKGGAPLLGEADLSILDAADEWAQFRRTQEARWVGLAIPRILLRLPYGKGAIPCERFTFEEVSGKPDPRTMLWANAAPFCAMLLGQAFEMSGWDMRPGDVRDVDDLPVYVYKDDGESVALPCAELELNEDTAMALADNGFMPIASIRNTDRVRVLRFQSVADPPSALPGRWSNG